jgi:hypothetical protein
VPVGSDVYLREQRLSLFPLPGRRWFVHVELRVRQRGILLQRPVGLRLLPALPDLPHLFGRRLHGGHGLHVEREVLGGPGLQQWDVRQLLHRRSVRIRRPLHGDALEPLLLVHEQQRLRDRPGLRLRHVHDRLPEESRLPAGPGMHQRRLRIVHVQHGLRICGNLQQRRLFVHHGGKLPVGSGMPQRHLRHVPVGLGLRQWPDLPVGSLQRVLDERRLQRRGPGTCPLRQLAERSDMRQRRMRRVHVEQPVLRRASVRAGHVRYMRHRLAVWNERQVPVRLLRVRPGFAVWVGAEVRRGCLRKELVP